MAQPYYGQPGQQQYYQGQPQQGAFYGQPAYGQPAYGQPMAGQPVMAQPVYVQPAQQAQWGQPAPVAMPVASPPGTAMGMPDQPLFAGQKPERFTPSSQYRDLWAAIAFVIHLIVVIAVGAYCWSNQSKSTDSTSGSTTTVNNSTDWSAKAGIMIAFCLAAGFFLSLLSVVAVRAFTK